MNNIKKIKLLIITPTLQCGGSEKMVSMVCNHINTELFSVCLVVVNNSKPFYGVNNPAVEVVNLQKGRVLFSLLAIKKTVKRFDPDILFSTANHLNIYLAIFKNNFNPKIKFIAREASIVSINSRQAKMPFVYNRLIRLFYKRFDHIICQSAYMQQDLVRHYNIPLPKTSVIHNGVKDVPVTIAAWQSSVDHVYKFISVARLSKEKGIERLIHAAGLLSVPFKYHIIGEGERRSALQQLVNELQLQDKVFLEGERGQPFSGMEDADLFLMGSYYEGFPNAALEAGAHGIPVIAFNVPGGIAEIIADNENGILIEDNDIIAFAAAVNRGQGFNREKIRNETLSRFSINRMMEQLQKLFLPAGENK